MIYYINPGDTLYRIARRFSTSVSSILNANVICNPSLIYPRQPIIIPEPGLDLPIAGGLPYYVVLPGDNLWCLAQKFNTSVSHLVKINNIPNPDLILPGSELLVVPEVSNPEQLKQSWERLGQNCDLINTLQVHGILYLGSFSWEALDTAAFSYLLDFLNNPCGIIRYYAIISLGRIGKNDKITDALNKLLEDPESYVASVAKLAIQRIEVLKRRSDRIHITLNDTILLNDPNLNSPFTEIPEGSEVIVSKWHIPSPTGEEGPRGDIQMYDWSYDIRTGRTGYLPRALYREITII